MNNGNYGPPPGAPYRSSNAEHDAVMTALMQKVSVLQKVYFVLFGLSLVFLFMPGAKVIWAITLASAVATRLYRQSQVNKYNAMLNQGPGPLV